MSKTRPRPGETRSHPPDTDIATLRGVKFVCLSGAHDVSISLQSVTIRGAHEAAVSVMDIKKIMMDKTPTEDLISIKLARAVKVGKKCRSMFTVKFMTDMTGSAIQVMSDEDMETWFAELKDHLVNRKLSDIFLDMLGYVTDCKYVYTGAGGFNELSPKEQYVAHVSVQFCPSKDDMEYVTFAHKPKSFALILKGAMFPRVEDMHFYGQKVIAFNFEYKNVVHTVGDREKMPPKCFKFGVVMRNGDIAKFTCEKISRKKFDLLMSFFTDRMAPHVLCDSLDEYTYIAPAMDSSADSSVGFDMPLEIEESVLESIVESIVDQEDEGNNPSDVDRSTNPSGDSPNVDLPESVNVGDVDKESSTIAHTPEGSLDVPPAEPLITPRLVSTKSMVARSLYPTSTSTPADPLSDSTTPPPEESAIGDALDDTGVSPAVARVGSGIIVEEADSPYTLNEFTNSFDRENNLEDSSQLADSTIDSEYPAPIEPYGLGPYYKGMRYGDIQINPLAHVHIFGAKGEKYVKLSIEYQVSIDVGAEHDESLVRVYAQHPELVDMCIIALSKMATQILDAMCDVQPGVAKRDKAVVPPSPDHDDDQDIDIVTVRFPSYFQQLLIGTVVDMDKKAIDLQQTYGVSITGPATNDPTREDEVTIKGRRRDIPNAVRYVEKMCAKYESMDLAIGTFDIEFVFRVIGKTPATRLKVCARNDVEHILLMPDGVTVAILALDDGRSTGQAQECMDNLQFAQEKMNIARGKRLAKIAQKEQRAREAADIAIDKRVHELTLDETALDTPAEPRSPAREAADIAIDKGVHELPLDETAFDTPAEARSPRAKRPARAMTNHGRAPAKALLEPRKATKKKKDDDSAYVFDQETSDTDGGVSEEEGESEKDPAQKEPPKKKAKKQPRQDVKIRNAELKAKALAFELLPEKKDEINLEIAGWKEFKEHALGWQVLINNLIDLRDTTMRDGQQIAVCDIKIVCKQLAEGKTSLKPLSNREPTREELIERRKEWMLPYLVKWVGRGWDMRITWKYVEPNMKRKLYFISSQHVRTNYTMHAKYLQDKCAAWYRTQRDEHMLSKKARKARYLKQSQCRRERNARERAEGGHKPVIKKKSAPPPVVVSDEEDWSDSEDEDKHEGPPPANVSGIPYESDDGFDSSDEAAFEEAAKKCAKEAAEHKVNWGAEDESVVVKKKKEKSAVEEESAVVEKHDAQEKMSDVPKAMMTVGGVVQLGPKVDKTGGVGKVSLVPAYESDDSNDEWEENDDDE